MAQVAGDVAFSAHRASRTWTPSRAASERDLSGPLRAGGVRVLVGVFALAGLAVGAVEVVVPASLDAMGHRELTGLLLGVWGVGSLLAGVAMSRVGAARDGARRLSLLLALWGATHAAVAIAGAPGHARAHPAAGRRVRSHRRSSSPTRCSTRSRRRAR